MSLHRGGLSLKTVTSSPLMFLLTFTPDVDSCKVVVDDAHDRPYKFEEVFEESCTQEIVFRKAVAPLVTKVKEGHNATIFAYGQTGSGKTFTMGTNPCSAKEDEGILQRALHTLLDVSETSQPSQDLELRSSQCVTVSFIEIYNKKLFDLLTPTRVPLKTKLGLGGAVSPVAMVEKNVKSIEEGLVLLEKGNSLRSVGATAMNQHSSRSHALIYLTLKLSQYNVTQMCLKCFILNSHLLAVSEPMTNHWENIVQGGQFTTGISYRSQDPSTARSTAPSHYSSSGFQQVSTPETSEAFSGACTSAAATHIRIVLLRASCPQQAAPLEVFLDHAVPRSYNGWFQRHPPQWVCTTCYDLIAEMMPVTNIREMRN
nr:chromosome-associated kinesin KIF4-like [Cherax quadricarinatus]